VDHQDDDVTELTFHQCLELSMQASQCPFSPPSDADRQLQAAIRTEMALFATTGHRGPLPAASLRLLDDRPSDVHRGGESILSCRNFVL